MIQINVHIALFMMGVVTFILGDCLIGYKNYYRFQDASRRNYLRFVRIILANLALLILDTLTNVWRVQYSSVSSVLTVHRVTMVIVLINYYFLIGMFLFHLIEHISVYTKVSPVFKWVIAGFCSWDAVLWSVSVKTDIIFRLTPEGYERGPLYVLGNLGGFVCMIIGICLVVRYHGQMRKNEIYMFTVPFLFPVMVVVIRQFVNGMSLMPSAVALGVAVYYSLFRLDQIQTFSRQQEELYLDKISLMMGQIKPHFLYNTLNSIYVLCEEDPATAQKAISDFSDYLRGNMESLDHEELIPFSRDLEHTKHYLEIEKLRFSDILQVEYDLETQDFLVPSLTLEPIVENAVKHGVTRKREGGTIRISTRKTSRGNDIIVEDDGVGFLPEESISEEKEHLGIANVRSRLRLLCGGSLEISSVRGEGTRVTIHVPLKKYQFGGGLNENHRYGR